MTRWWIGSGGYVIFEIHVLLEDLRFAVIIPLYKGKEKRLNVRTIEALVC